MSDKVYKTTGSHYPELSNSVIQDRVNELRQKWLRFWKLSLSREARESGWTFKVSNFALIDAVVRVDKRRAYYSFFHDMPISERKAMGLYAYWIVKYRPFSVMVDDAVRLTADQKEWIESVNEQFAAYLLYASVFSGAKMLASSSSVDKKIAKISTANKSYHRALIYSLRFRCNSIDSTMLLVETMTPESFKRPVAPK